MQNTKFKMAAKGSGQAWVMQNNPKQVIQNKTFRNMNQIYKLKNMKHNLLKYKLYAPRVKQPQAK